MTLETWLAFSLASAVLVVIPGPTVLLVVSYALADGRRSAWATVPGVALGDCVALAGSFLGLGALLAVSALWFAVLKWIGAAYLIYLGIRMWRQAPDLSELPGRDAGRPAARVLGHAFAVTALNPKGIVFFVAFLPQFISHREPLLPQMLLLGGTFVLLAVVNVIGYSQLAGSVRETLRRPGALRALQRLGGTVLIGAGVLTAAWRRAA
jgi:threonine/homoserine/homoserine lactone efflux protein